jgi:phosphatidylserine/phosphatidylglycerophosphate/cardiolipin synthase-like enzyme
MLQTISGRDFPVKVIPLIEQAKKSIDIVVFDWRWYPSDPGAACQLFNQAIICARRRGVAVRALVNNCDIAKILLNEGCQAKRLISTKLMHCKLMIIDNDTIITGSHNYSQAAFQMNFELSVIIKNEPVSADFNKFFNNLWNL